MKLDTQGIKDDGLRDFQQRLVTVRGAKWFKREDFSGPEQMPDLDRLTLTASDVFNFWEACEETNNEAQAIVMQINVYRAMRKKMLKRKVVDGGGVPKCPCCARHLDTDEASRAVDSTLSELLETPLGEGSGAIADKDEAVAAKTFAKGIQALFREVTEPQHITHKHT
jgi:hypothetical protein